MADFAVTHKVYTRYFGPGIISGGRCPAPASRGPHLNRPDCASMVAEVELNACHTGALFRAQLDSQTERLGAELTRRQLSCSTSTSPSNILYFSRYWSAGRSMVPSAPVAFVVLENGSQALIMGCDEVPSALEAGTDQVPILTLGSFRLECPDEETDSAAKGLPGCERSHIGHGTGLKMYEQDSISATAEYLYVESMTADLEMPYYELGWGGTRVEDPVSVTESGCRFLTESPTSPLQAMA